MANSHNWRDQLKAVLCNSPVFGALSVQVIDALCSRAEHLSAPGGEWVLREGDPSDSMIFVISGRLRAWRLGPEGGFMPYNEIGPGESVGETGMILQHKRTANVSALRDSTLAVLSRAHFEEVLAAHPVALNRAFSEAIYQHLRHSGQRSDRDIRHSFLVVPLHPGDEALLVARGLTEAFARLGRTQHIHLESEHGAHLAGGDMAPRIGQLDALERDFDFLIFQAEHEGQAWARIAARQADQVIFVASAEAQAQVSPIERLLADEPGFVMKRKHLVLAHPGQARAPRGLAQWRAGRELERIYPLRVGHAADFSRLTRFLLGRAVGLVLGGGAARGLAHLGALKAFEDHALPIDLIGGNSMGALIGAQYAMGRPLDEIRQNLDHLTRQGAALTLPSVSLLSGRRFEHSLQQLFGQSLIEDLWRPFFAAACNLSRARTVALDRGLLWRAVLASNSPAGLLPPVLHQGELLVDGAILDNVPVGEMRVRLGIPLERRRGNGSIIAIDVDAADPFCVPPDLHHLPLLRRPKFKGRKLPGIVDILYRAGHIGGLNTRGRTAALADFFLAPPLSQFPLLGYERAPEIIETGYRHAMQEIERWTNLPRH